MYGAAPDLHVVASSASTSAPSPHVVGFRRSNGLQVRSANKRTVSTDADSLCPSRLERPRRSGNAFRYHPILPRTAHFRMESMEHWVVQTKWMSMAQTGTHQTRSRLLPPPPRRPLLRTPPPRLSVSRCYALFHVRSSATAPTARNERCTCRLHCSYGPACPISTHEPPPSASTPRPPHAYPSSNHNVSLSSRRSRISLFDVSLKLAFPSVTSRSPLLGYIIVCLPAEFIHVRSLRLKLKHQCQ